METGSEEIIQQIRARVIQTLGAQLWNELPLTLRELEEHGIIRKNLKTLLYKREYAL